MGGSIRKGGTRNAPGWHWDVQATVWACDKHGSKTCTVCTRPTLEPGDERTWLLDVDGTMMPEPTKADVPPQPASVVGRGDGPMPVVDIGIDMGARELADITSDVAEFCADRGDGLVNVFLTHATAGLAIIELGHGTEHDVIQHIEKLAPQDAAYGNVCGRGDEGSDHLMPVMLAPTLTIPVINSELGMSRSQSIVLIDRFYGYTRRVRLSFLSAGVGA